MEGPGMSLFQGAASIHINNSAQDRLEEQEELEDQKRRNEELKHKLANAFDDLYDDDEASSVNSSGNFTLDATHTNGAQGQPRSGLPPTYIESLNHLKEANDSPKAFCDTPKNHITHAHHEEGIKSPYSPYGGGDGQNHFFHQDYRGHHNGINNFDARQEYMNNEQLKVMYEMRLKECQQLATQVEKSDTEIESLRARLAAAVNDKDKAELSLQEAHHLLASSKHKSIELEQQMTTLTQKLVENEQEKEQLRLELRSANISLQDVQQRLHTLQVAHTHDTDALFREQQDRHREEIDRLQNDFMKAKSRLDEKENEIKVLEKRCMEKDREKEEILIEKGGTINRLAGELEAAQNRLVSGEGARLKEKVLQLTTERNTAREQVKELGSKLELTAHELVLCRNKLANSQKEYENWRTTLNQILMESLPDNSLKIGEPPSPEKLATLKDILNRYKLQVQKLSTLQEEVVKRDKKLEQHRKQESELRSKIEEYKGIEMQLNSKLAVLHNQLELVADSGERQLLHDYQQHNQQLADELEQARAQLKALDLKYTEIEMEYEKLKTEKGSRASIAQEANAELRRELERCSAQLKQTLSDNAQLKNLYLQVCSARDAVSRELKDNQMKIQKEREMYKTQEREYIERIERQKMELEKAANDLTNAREELDRANKRISELQKEFTDKQKEFTEKLNKYLEDEKSAMRKEIPCLQCEKLLKQIKYLEEQLNKCTLKLSTQESSETLMKELKGKAEFFQQYIVERYQRLVDQRCVATNTDHTDHSDHIDHTTHTTHQPHEDDIAAKTSVMMREKAIREQLAEKFTLEMKTLEMNCTRRIQELEAEQSTTINKLKEMLERKAHEVETLKEFILSERAKVTEILEAKEKEISVLIKEHNELINECQKAKDSSIEWRLKAERYKERLTKLGSLEDMLKKEREDWKKKTNVCASEWQALKVKVTELQEQLAQQEQTYAKLQTEYHSIQDKYKNAKKTVYTYKDYMSKKDAHINSEINRIQDEYRKIFVKLQNQINYHINCRIQEDRNRGKRTPAQQYPEYDCTEMINKLNEDFSRLAQDNFKEGQSK